MRFLKSNRLYLGLHQLSKFIISMEPVIVQYYLHSSKKDYLLMTVVTPDPVIQLNLLMST